MSKKNSIQSMLQDYRILIWNAADDPIIQSRIEPLGYTSEKLQQGKDLYLEVKNLSENQRKEYAEYYTAADAFQEAKEEADKDYRRIRKYARFVFADNTMAWNKLELGKKIPFAFPEWHNHVSLFYKELLADANMTAPLLPYGFVVENITAEVASLESLFQLQQNREREVGDAEHATKVRDAKLEELSDFCKHLRDLVRLIFEDEETQYLEKLGLLARS